MTSDGPPPMPRWVKLSLIAGGLLLVALLAFALLSPGGHGPRMHG